ncbi:MAG: hypothetical protein ACOCZ6_00770 [Nanoarchaeota archaeon]
MKRSQVANEFMILFGVMIVVTLVFLIILNNYADMTATDEEEKVMNDFGHYLQNEFITASEVKDGYVREIYLPQTIEGFEYTVSNTNRSITVISTRSEIEFYYPIPEVHGTLDKGHNKIKKRDGNVYIQ